MYTETPGKAHARRFFYETFLPDILPEEILLVAEYLILLGWPALELPYLDRLGVKRSQIYSVERELVAYREQSKLVEPEEMHLYLGDLTDYIQRSLDSNRRFGVLNLDICGSYLNGIDPALTTILLFARRQPQSVIATYSSVGRDQEQLLEGLKSLALFLWYAPEATEAMLTAVVGGYRQAGLSETVSWNLLLRHCFWLRSHLEHAAAGAHSIGRADAQHLKFMFDEQEVVWKDVAAKVTLPLRYDNFLATVQEQAPPQHDKPVLDLGFQRLRLMTYAATGSFYHNCYFTAYRSLPKVVGPRKWIEQALAIMMEFPPVFIDRQGIRVDPVGELPDLSPTALLVKGADLAQPTRRVAIPPLNPNWKAASVKLGACLPLTDKTVAKIYRLLERTPELVTADLLPQLPPGINPAQVTAHLAVARRNRRGPVKTK